MITAFPTKEARNMACLVAVVEGANYLVEFHDVRGRGLSVAITDWVPDGQVWYDPEIGVPRFVERAHFGCWPSQEE